MIRRMTDNDIESLSEIWLNENIRAHGFIDKKYWLDHFSYVKAALPQAQVYVYEKDNKPAGFIGLNGNYIEGIFVDSRYQSQGIGRELMDYAKNLHTELTLKVYEKNEKALDFYIKQGFKTVDKETDTGTNQKEILMKWQSK